MQESVNFIKYLVCEYPILYYPGLLGIPCVV
jgi:hypothetical protein